MPGPENECGRVVHTQPLRRRAALPDAAYFACLAIAWCAFARASYSLAAAV